MALMGSVADLGGIRHDEHGTGPVAGGEAEGFAFLDVAGEGGDGGFCGVAVAEGFGAAGPVGEIDFGLVGCGDDAESGVFLGGEG